MFKADAIPVDGIDGIYIREWSGVELVEWEDALAESRLKSGNVSVGTLRATCIALSLCDANGKRTHTVAQRMKCVEGLTQAETKSLFSQASKLNGVMTGEDSIEVAEGN